jgi:hypothetical protein
MTWFSLVYYRCMKSGLIVPAHADGPGSYAPDTFVEEWMVMLHIISHIPEPEGIPLLQTDVPGSYYRVDCIIFVYRFT